MNSALLSLLVLGSSYASSFAEDEGPLPWGVRYQYEKTNVNIPADHSYFVTVIYSTPDASSEQDKYLRWWFYNHPALIDLKQKTNFREVSINDPIYASYLQQAVPSPPAVLVTLPADQGYFGRAVYCAYAQYLPTDPNQLVRELQATFSKYSQVYGAINSCQNSEQCWPRNPPPPQYYPQQFPQQYPQTIQPLPPIVPDTRTTDTSTLLLLAGAAVVIFLIARRGRR